MDHRKIQRTLFRMQLDPAFAARLRSSVPEAIAGLGAAEVDLLRGADPTAVSADRDGKRRAQFLANVAGEFALSTAAGLDVEGFTASAEFHEAVSTNRSLPLAVAGYARRCTRAQSGALRALVALEAALARARRALRECRAPGPGEIALAPWAFLEVLPAGTLALAAALRAALDKGEAPLPCALADAPDETLLVRAAPAITPFRLRSVEVEHTSPALAALLRAALEPVTRSMLATTLSLDTAELDPVLDELIAERVLVCG